MQMKTGVEQSVYAMLLLTFLPEKGVLPGEFISQQLGASPTYFQKLAPEARECGSADLCSRCKRRLPAQSVTGDDSCV